MRLRTLSNLTPIRWQSQQPENNTSSMSATITNAQNSMTVLSNEEDTKKALFQLIRANVNIKKTFDSLTSKEQNELIELIIKIENATELDEISFKLAILFKPNNILLILKDIIFTKMFNDNDDKNYFGSALKDLENIKKSLETLEEVKKTEKNSAASERLEECQQELKVATLKLQTAKSKILKYGEPLLEAMKVDSTGKKNINPYLYKTALKAESALKEVKTARKDIDNIARKIEEAEKNVVQCQLNLIEAGVESDHLILEYDEILKNMDKIYRNREKFIVAFAILDKLLNESVNETGRRGDAHP